MTRKEDRKVLFLDFIVLIIFWEEEGEGCEVGLTLETSYIQIYIVLSHFTATYTYEAVNHVLNIAPSYIHTYI